MKLYVLKGFLGKFVHFPIKGDRCGCAIPHPVPFLPGWNANVMSGSSAATCKRKETSMRATANLLGWRLEITDRTLVCEGITE